MLNSFRMFPKIGGWLYTEHHDVINEWNGYWRYDRSDKETGLGEIVQGMSLRDLHSAVYLSTGNDICLTVDGGQAVEVPLFLSVMTGENHGKELKISYELSLTNYIGETEKNLSGSFTVDYTPWMQEQLEPLPLKMPDIEGLAELKLIVSDPSGNILHRNFMHFEIAGKKDLSGLTVLSTPVKDFTKAEWSKKQWSVMDGKKVNGAGKGYFEYSIDLPEGVLDRPAKEAFFIIEVSAKELFVKDMEDYHKDQDFMLGSKVAPSANPNSYPMTDEQTFPSKISVTVNGQKVTVTVLPDDPADHRGVLSWHHQLEDRKLREAGSYGYLVKVNLFGQVLENLKQDGKLNVRLETEGEGGIAVYGKDFGRYPLDPSLVIKY